MNTESLDGCPIRSPDGLSLYIASTRPGCQGGLEIWVAHRPSTDVGFGTPVNLTPVNSAVDDFCPTPVRGKGLLFVSRRAGGWAANSAAITTSTAVAEPNTAANEFGPNVRRDGREIVFDSGRAGGRRATGDNGRRAPVLGRGDARSTTASGP